MLSKLYTCVYSESKEVQIKTCTVHWTILDFVWLLNTQTNREIRTNPAKDYPDNINPDSMFELKIKFLGVQNDLIEFYFLPPAPMYMKFNIYIDEIMLLTNKSYQWVQINKWQLMTVQTKQTLVHKIEKSREYFSESDNLDVKFEFFVDSYDANYKSTHKSISVCDKDYYNDMIKAPLSQDLLKLLNNPSFSDVKIVSHDGTVFYAHKVILFNRSSVLKAHFEHSTVESLTDIVNSPFETEVVEEVLSYIYTDNSPRLNEMPEKLLAASDFYQLKGLKNLCEKALYKKLTVDNVIEILELATLNMALNLKKQAIEFINSGIARDVINTKGWKRLQSTELIKSIYEYSVINS